MYFFRLIKIYLRTFEPINNSCRFKQKVVSTYFYNKDLNRLRVGKKNFAGRNNSGKITVNHKGGGTKKKIDLIDFNRKWSNKIALCISLNKDCIRTCFTALIKYSNGTYSYILAASSLKSGKFIFSTIKPSSFSYKYKEGCSILLKHSHYTHMFFNLQINLVKGGQYARSGGVFCKVISINLNKNTARVSLPTGIIKIISIFCTATLGRASNIYHNREFFVKAGYYRNKNTRPSVRGVAMNPVDHPHGGRTKTSSPEYTPWGKIAKFNK